MRMMTMMIAILQPVRFILKNNLKLISCCAVESPSQRVSAKGLPKELQRGLMEILHIYTLVSSETVYIYVIVVHDICGLIKI